jgi:release factor glutamine methyltransferase
VTAAVASALRAAGCVFADDEARLLTSAAGSGGELVEMVERRCAGEPLEHILGWAEFLGRRVAVEAGVFVPRRRSEHLARRAVAAAGGRPCPVVVDLCCGSGAIGAAVAAELGSLQLHAVDIDARAAACARRNLATAGGRVYFGDLYEPLPARLRGGVDVVVANAPYVPSGELRTLPSEAREHEPRASLEGGADGLDVVRRVLAGAARWLAPGGYVLVETSERQTPRAREAAAGAGLLASVERSDDLDATVVVGSLPAGGVRGRPHSAASILPLRPRSRAF